MLEIKLDGVDELLRNLKKVEEKFRRKIVLKALRKGGKLIVKSARGKINNRTGELRRSLGIVAVPKRKAFNTIIDIGPRVLPNKKSKNEVGQTFTPMNKRKSAGVYGLWVEFGTKHSSAKPFLRPAFDSQSAKALDLIVEEMAKELEKAL